MKKEVVCDGKPCILPQCFELREVVSRIVITPNASNEILEQMEKNNLDTKVYVSKN